MMAEAQRRKLAAILVGDVVDYSRLMAEDESATVRTLTAYREEVAMLVRQHRGRLENFTGDAFLAYFTSAVDAVECGLAIQRVVAARNANLPAERYMQFRIGAHLGELRIEGGRVYGNGPNIAARLENLAEPGGICLSATLVEQVEGKVEARFRSLGEQALKNIPRPVSAFAAVPTGVTKAAEQNSEPSRALVITAFATVSSSPDDAYLARGLAEDVATLLIGNPDFRILPRLDVRGDTGERLEPLVIARQLGVRYAVSGSVRRVGDRIRVTVNLVDAEEQDQIWGKHYDRNYSDLLTLQDEIAESIATTLDSRLWYAEVRRARRSRAENLDAWALVQRAIGGAVVAGVGRAALSEAEELLRRALEIDPDYPLAQATLALVLGNQVRLLYSQDWEKDTSEALALAKSAAERAAEDPRVAFRIGGAYWRLGRVEEALPFLQQSLRVDPNWLPAQADLGQVQVRMGQVEEGLERLQNVVENGAGDPQLYAYELYLGFGRLLAGDLEGAESALRNSLRTWHRLHITWFLLALALAMRDRTDEASRVFGRARALEPAIPVERYEDLIRFVADEPEPLIDLLRRIAD